MQCGMPPSCDQPKANPYRTLPILGSLTRPASKRALSVATTYTQLQASVTNLLIINIYTSLPVSCSIHIIYVCSKTLSLDFSTSEAAIMKKSLILASAGLAGLTNAAVHTLKLQKIPLSEQLVR